MSETPPTLGWVDLSREMSSPLHSRRNTPVPFGSREDYMRMLREAQSETSCRTSARVSPITSAFMSRSTSNRNSPTPRSCCSPNNSPCVEPADSQDSLPSGIYINRLKESESAAISEFIWDWSSRPNLPGNPLLKRTKKTSPIKEPKSRRRAMYSMILSNLLSLILGAGVGIWLYRRSAARSLGTIFLD